MRIAQCWEQLSSFPGKNPRALRATQNHFEARACKLVRYRMSKFPSPDPIMHRSNRFPRMAAAFWQWERRVFLVCDYLRYIRRLERNLSLNDRDRSVCGLASGMLQADAPINYKHQALETAEDKLKHDILSCPKARGEFTSAPWPNKFQASCGLVRLVIGSAILISYLDFEHALQTIA